MLLTAIKANAQKHSVQGLLERGGCLDVYNKKDQLLSHLQNKIRPESVNTVKMCKFKNIHTSDSSF